MGGMKRVIILFLALCIGSGASAQTPSPFGDSAKAMVGSWEFSNADRDKICTVTFKPDRTAVGYKVEFNGGCAALFPLVADIAGWNFPDNDLLRLVDAQGRALAEFSEVEDGIYEAPTPGIGVLFIQSAASAAPPPKRPEEVAGEWAIAGQTELCVVSLSTAAASGGAMSLTVKPGCRDDIARLNFTRWRIEGGELQLLPSQGTTPWRFVESDSDNWRRIPEAAEPVNLVRR